MNLIWLLLRASGLKVVVAVLTGLISGGTTARLIALINTTLTQGISPNQTATNSVWLFVTLAGIILISSIISQVLLINISQDAVYRLRLRLSKGILSSELRHLEQLGTPRLLATLTDDVATLSNTVYAIPFICVDIAVICGCLIYLGVLSGAVFACTIGFMMVAIGSIQLLINRAGHFLNLAREEQDRLFKHFNAITHGIKELKLHASRRQQFFSQELQKSAASSRDQNAAALFTFSISTGWGNLLFFLLVGSLMFGLPRMLTTPSSIISSYILTLTYMMLPMQSILDKLQALSRASVALQKIERMGLTLASSREGARKLETNARNRFSTLQLQRVTHAYPSEQGDNQFTLGPVDITLQAGEVIFIVGGNGSGKSTLAKLITGLYIPESGSIKLDGNIVNDDNREMYRQYFSVVFSDFFLFDRLLGMTNPNLDVQAREYLQQLRLERKVRIENGKLSTTQLSQGQRKRLALLTAYLEDRPIYLFDEWASDQDPTFRDIFYRQILLNLKQRNKTVVVVSHDDHYFDIADRIIKLDYGRVEYDRRN